MQKEPLSVALTRQFNRSSPTDADSAGSWQAHYVRGFVDAYLNLAYHTELLNHRFQICVPTSDPYRIGYLDGLAARS